MSMKWITPERAGESHKLWEMLVDDDGRVVASVERFYETMPTYANVYAPEHQRRVVSLYDYDLKRVVPSIEEQDKRAREWCEASVKNGGDA
ncbi:hypothetical protein [Microvirga mediterraneensis]|uniref:Uncharacterized protein n=1 Tax=Microvirga mediterraneensis TaxID=2754695 RepID=A0A838BW69_9HYPH|nr:hypothetical protein [Microvirga mediterraneensis]MBA1159352.1 hypothetical protein [Microvirga mediterraneensis]